MNAVMDLISVATLAMFGSALVGGLVGFAIGWMTRFDVGLLVGLTIFGGTTLWFAARCFSEYREFVHAGPNAVWGEVIAIEDQPVNPSGTTTTPVPLVRFTAPDESVHTVRGPAASGAKQGQHLNVVYDALDAQRSKVGLASNYRGGAIAFMLFGTFPLSFAVILLHGMLFERNHRDPRAGNAQEQSRRNASGRMRAAASRVEGKRQDRPPPAQRPAGRVHKLANAALFFGLLGAIVWAGSVPDELEHGLVQGFGAIAAILFGYAFYAAVATRTVSSLSVRMAMLALNFGLFAYAVHLVS